MMRSSAAVQEWSRIGKRTVMDRQLPQSAATGPHPGGVMLAGNVDHDLSLVIPAHNEAQRLPATLAAALDILDGWGLDYRILVVDDGSTDGTPDIASQFGPRVSVARQINRGKGAAVRRGMLSASGRVVAFTDADLPYDLSALRQAYQRIAAGEVQVVFGARSLDASESTVPRRFLRGLASTVFRRIRCCILPGSVADTQCGLKAFSREAAHILFARAVVNGFAFDAEVVYLTQRLGISFACQPVVLVNEEGSSVSLRRHAMPMLRDILAVQRRDRVDGYEVAAFVEARSRQWARQSQRARAA